MMPRNKMVSFLLVIFLALASGLLLASCGASERHSSSIADEAVSEAPEMDFGYDGAEEGVNDSKAGAGAAPQRYAVLTGSLELTVLNTRDTVKKVKEIAASAGGFISDSYVYEFREEHYGAELTMRIPAARFDAVMDQLQELGKPANIKKGDDDVTLTYVDMEARIKSLEAQEERLREILEMADTVEDVLNVERELQRVRGEIESMTTQFTLLQDRVTLATINVRLKEEVVATQQVSSAPFENLGGRAKEAFVRSINFLARAAAGMVVVLATLLPVLFVLAVVAVVIWLLVMRINRFKNPPAA